MLGSLQSRPPVQKERVDRFQGVRAAILELSLETPDQLLVTLNLRNRQLFDVHRIALSTGAVALDTENPGDVASWVVDAQLNVRGAKVVLPDGGNELRVRDGPGKPWRTLQKVGPEDMLGLDGFSRDGKSVYLQSSVGRDTVALFARPLEGGADRTVARRNAAEGAADRPVCARRAVVA
jgi:hypothetical protein